MTTVQTIRINVRNTAQTAEQRVHEAAHAAIDAITANMHAAVSSADAPAAKVETVLRLHALQSAVMRTAQRHAADLADAARDAVIL